MSEGQKARVFWFTGLSGAGKSTLAERARERLRQKGWPVAVLDGDVVRRGLCRDLGFSLEDRRENNRRCAEVAKILACTADQICLCSFISPVIALRAAVRSIIGDDLYREIYIKCDLRTCIARDPKGNYAKALAGKLAGYTGIDSPYEEPLQPDCVLETGLEDEEQCTARLVTYIEQTVDPSLKRSVYGRSRVMAS